MSTLERLEAALREGELGYKLYEYARVGNGVLYATKLPARDVDLDQITLRGFQEQSGYCSIPVASEDQERHRRFVASAPRDPREIVEEALSLDPMEILLDRGLDGADPFMHVERNSLPKPPVPWTLEFNALGKLAAVKRAKVDLVFVPTENLWEIPAYFSFGGWNDCPTPAEHCALLKYWSRSIEMTLDFIWDEGFCLHMVEPPASFEDAVQLAREYACYCPDIFDQGQDSMEMHVARILAPYPRTFWWD